LYGILKNVATEDAIISITIRKPKPLPFSSKKNEIFSKNRPKTIVFSLLFAILSR
jgi:hypothetical protein